MPKKNSPGGCKCCCGIFKDSLNNSEIKSDWTQDAGTWTETTVLTTSDTTAAISLDGAAGDDLEKRQRVTVNTNANNDRVRLMLDYEDEDNYIAGDFKFHSTTPTMAVVRRSSGSDNFVVGNTSVGAGLLDPGTDTVIEVCSKNDTFNAYIINGQTAITAPATITNEGAAIGTGTTVSGDIDFSNYKLFRVTDDCPQCRIACASCENGVVQAVQVDISGATGSRSGFETCTPGYEVFNGSHLFQPVQTGIACFDVVFLDVTCDPPDTFDVVVQLRLYYFSGIDTYRISVTLGYGGGSVINEYTKDYVSTPLECLSFDAVELTETGAGVGDLDSITVTVSSV